MSDELNKLFKKRQSLEFDYNNNWHINESSISGFGVFTSRNFETGDLLFEDVPIVLGPRASILPPACVSCMKIGVALNACSKGCRLPVCSSECENTTSHMKECELLNKFSVKEGEFWSPLLYRALAPFRCLLASDLDKQIIKSLTEIKNTKHIEIIFLKKELRKGFTEEEESFLTMSCGVLNGTAFETEVGDDKVKASLRGLYPLAGMMNHSCVPNTQRYFLVRNNIQVMSIAATCPIPEGTELTTNYSYLFWPTIVRRHFLSMTKQFWCTCARCRDPTEFGTNFSALECSCGGLILPLCAIDMNSRWKCGGCNNVTIASKLPYADPAVVLAHNEGNFPYKMKYLTINEKLNKIWNMGHGNATYQDLSDEDLNDKENIARELITLNDNLKLGDSKIKGMLLRELYETLEEKNNRKHIIDEEELFSILENARKILNIPIQ